MKALTVVLACCMSTLAAGCATADKCQTLKAQNYTTTYGGTQQ